MVAALSSAEDDDDANWITIPAFPITALKVAEFLQYERTTHEKVCCPFFHTFSSGPLTAQKNRVKGGKDHTPLSSGKEAISQAISALEQWFHSHAYSMATILSRSTGTPCAMTIRSGPLRMP